MNVSTSITMEPDAEDLGNVFAAVEEFGERAEWPANRIFQVKLILEEMALNVINYGGGEGLAPIHIKLTTKGDTVTIDITDVGQPFDPIKEAPSPDLSLSLEERPIGGLGLYLVRTMVDEMHYRWQDGQNHLKLITRRLA